MEFVRQTQRVRYDSRVVLVRVLYRYIYPLAFQVMNDEEKVMRCVSQAQFRKMLYQKMVFLVHMSQPLQYLMER